MLGERCQARIRSRAARVGSGGDLGDQRGVDRIGLGSPLLEAAPAVHLHGVEDEYHKAMLAKVLCDCGLVVAGSLKTDALHTQVSQAVGDEGMSVSIIGCREALGAPGDGHVEGTLGDIDTGRSRHG